MSSGFCRTGIPSDLLWAQVTSDREGQIDIAEDDTVLTLNCTTNVAEWQPVLGVCISPRTAREMIPMEGRSHSSLSSPQHGWPSEYYYRRTGTARRKNADGTWACTGGRSPSTERGYDRRFVTSETLTDKDRLSSAVAVVDLPVEAVHTAEFVELVAWFWTEGSIAKSRGKLTDGVTIYQSHMANPDLVDRIHHTLKKLYGDPVAALARQGDSVPRWRVYRNGHKTEFRLNHVAGRRLLEVPLGYGTSLYPSHCRGEKRWSLHVGRSERATRFFPVAAPPRGRHVS